MIAVITLLILGALLLLAETILPGLIAGILGLLCLVLGVALSYLKLGMARGHLTLFIVAVLLMAGCAAWIKYFPTSRMAQVFVSHGTIGEINAEKPQLLHQVGTAYTNLRPSGTALIDGQKVDVVTEGAMVTKGTPLKVIALEGIRVVVRPI